MDDLKHWVYFLESLNFMFPSVSLPILALASDPDVPHFVLGNYKNKDFYFAFKIICVMLSSKFFT